MSIWRMFMRLGSANVAMLAVHLVTIGLLGAFAPAAPFALFLLALSVSQPFSTFAGLRLDSAIPAIEGARERETLFVLALGSITAISLLQGIVVVILHRLGAFELDKLGPAGLAMLPLLTFCQAQVQLGRLWAVRFARVDRVTRATYHRAFTSLVARGVVLVVILVGRNGSLARHIDSLLIGGELVTTAIMAASLFPRNVLRNRLSLVDRAAVRAVLRRNWKFPLLETPSTILDNVAMNAPIFLVTQFYGLTATASFGLAFRGLAVPVSQISKTLTDVMQVRYSELQRVGEMTGLARLFRKSTLAMAAGAAVAIAFLVLAFAVTRGSLPAGRIKDFAIVLVLISPWVASSAVVNINSRLLLMLRRQELKLVYDFFAVASIGLLVVGHEILSPNFYRFVAMISAAQVAGYGCYWILLQRAVHTAENTRGRTAASRRA